jgi:L-methionine (R)-S-oxide reductase
MLKYPAMATISFNEILQSGNSRKEKARLIAEKIRSAKKYSWVGLYDVKDSQISIISFSGRTEPAFTSFPKQKGLNGKAVMLKQTVIVNDTNRDDDYLLTFTNTESEIIVPVFTDNNETVAGTIDAESETKNAFGREDAEFLEDCARAMRSLWSNN